MPNEYTFKAGTTFELDDVSRPSGSRIRICLARDGKWRMDASFSRCELPKRKPLEKFSDVRARDAATEKQVEAELAKLRKK